MVDEQKSAGGVRARVRAELTAEIKALATHQLETQGAAEISLRAIAREIGMASSAVYRYFKSRDELLTALIIDAFDDLGEHVERADAVHDRDDYRRRFTAIALSIRDWAVANPHQYALIYGSPVPGYTAPDDTVDPATRSSAALMSVLVDARAASTGRAPKDKSPKSLVASLEGIATFAGNALPTNDLSTAVEVFGEIFGLVSLELFGHFRNTVNDPAVFYAHAVDQMAERILRG